MLAFLTVLFSLSASADPACVDFGHLSKEGPMDVKVEQKGCESWRKTATYNGEVIGETTIVFSEKWDTRTIDDEWETSTVQTRWFFSADGKTLIDEGVIDSVYKKDGKKTFFTESSVYSLSPAGDRVLHRGYRIFREQLADGKVTTELKTLDDSWPRLAAPKN